MTLSDADIREIRRLVLKPGDALVVRMASDAITHAMADEIRNRIYETLRIKPQDVDILILGASTHLEVIEGSQWRLMSHGPSRPG